MLKDFTSITIVLDRSGSMATCYDDTLGGFNTFVDGQRKLPGVCELSLFQFDNDFEPVFVNCPISDAPPLSRLNYIPRGGTALYDAVARAIESTGKHYASLASSARPGKVLFAIITDGGENASTQFTREAVFKKIAHQTGRYNWEFVFIGANQDAYASAADIGIKTANVLNYAQTEVGTQAVFQKLNSNAMRYRAGGPGGQSVGASFTAEEQSTLE